MLVVASCILGITLANAYQCRRLVQRCFGTILQARRTRNLWFGSRRESREPVQGSVLRSSVDDDWPNPDGGHPMQDFYCRTSGFAVAAATMSLNAVNRVKRGRIAPAKPAIVALQSSKLSLECGLARETSVR